MNTATAHKAVAHGSDRASLSSAGSVQAKLSVGRAGDSYEQEADRTAEQVVGAQPTGSATATITPSSPTVAPSISRLVARKPDATLAAQREEKTPQAKLQRQSEEEPQAKLQRQEEEEPQATLQRSAAKEEEKEKPVQSKAEARPNVRDKRLYPEVDRVEDKLFGAKGGGQTLDEATRRQMEVGFGADFSGVRIHTGADAVAMNRELKAQAFTHGKDIFFNSGKYEPDSLRGRTLLAHELTHVVQQGAAEQKLSDEKVRRNNAERHRPPPEPADREARKAEQEATQAPADAAKTDSETPAGDREGAGGKVPEKAGVKKAAKGKIGGAGHKAAGPGKGEAKAKAEGGGVAAFLRRTTEMAFRAKKAKIGKLAANEQTKESPEKKLEQTEASVVPPAEEGKSRANASQVASVEKAEAPKPDEKKAKEKFDETLENAVPATLEEVDKFKEEGKGRVVGEAVKGVVSADTAEVKSTYQAIDSPPEPAPPEREPETLPEIEAAPETEAINPGDGVVGEVQPEHTDFSEFEQESDDLLKKEGIAEEHLAMVDEGDLAEANKDRSQLKNQVKKGPAEVKAQENSEKQVVDQALKKEELEGRHKMQQERRAALEGARGDQAKTKGKLELQRQKVTDHINSIYTSANENVKKKLEDLEKKSLKDFDDGQAKATRDFEDSVNRRIDAFKRRRYDRFGGGLLWAKDKLFGMDELPEVEAIFESEKSRFITAIDRLVKNITAENKRVVQECRDLVAKARKDIQVYVDALGPQLRQTGTDAMKDIKGKLDALDKQIDQKEQELKKKLAEKRAAAIKAIEQKIEKMKEEMSGLVSKLGNLLLDAMLKFFKWALKKAGYSPEQLMGILNKGKAVLKKIVGEPVAFIKNIVTAVKNGLGLFQKNIKKHLVGGMIDWLTGAMSEVPIQLPEKWDLKGIIHLVLQILGLTWDRIRAKLVKRLGERVVKIAETSVDIVKRLVTEGPIALWEMIKAKAGEIKQKVMDGVRNWAIVQLVKQGIIKLASFINPAGAIVQAVLAIYNTVMFFVENWQRITEFVNSIFNSISDIAMGRLSKAAQFVEKAMANTIPIILGFLARLIPLSGIGKTVSNIIKRIRRPIDKVVDKVINKVVNLANRLIKKAKRGAGKLKDKVVSWLTVRRRFNNRGGEAHTLFFRGKGKRGELWIASKKSKVKSYINKKRTELRRTPDKEQSRALDEAERLHGSIDSVLVKSPFTELHKKKLEGDVAALSRAFAKLTGGLADAKTPNPEWHPARGNSGAAKPHVVRVEKLSKEKLPRGGRPENTEASSPVTGWRKIVQNGLQKGGDKWVQMHLVNQDVGGEGKPYNLVPGPNSVNSGTMRSFESAAKRVIDKDAKTVVWWKTTVEYHSGKLKPYAKSVRMQLGLYLYKGANQWVKDPKPKMQDYSPVIAPPFTKKVPDLSSSTGTTLRAIDAKGLGVNPAILFNGVRIRRIKTERKTGGAFTDHSDFKSRLEALGLKELSTEHSRDNWRSEVAKLARSVKKLYAAGKLTYK